MVHALWLDGSGAYCRPWGRAAAPSFAFQRAARQPRPRAARHERHAERGEQPYDGDQLFASAGENDEIRDATVSGQAVHRVRHAFSPSFSNVSNADDRGEVPGKA